MIDYKTGEFTISESKATELQGKKIGSKVRAIINYQATDKTKSFTILKVRHLLVIQTKRII